MIINKKINTKNKIRKIAFASPSNNPKHDIPEPKAAKKNITDHVAIMQILKQIR